MIGERSNFIKTFIMIVLFSFIFERSYLKTKLILFSLFFVVIISIINFNPNFKARYLNHIINPFGSTLNSPVEYIFNSSMVITIRLRYKFMKITNFLVSA